ncbi:MAG: hypothetical protein ACREV4_09270 [Gammaproteobacteria bacterium]
MLFVLSFFKEGLEPAWHNYLLLVVGIPVIAFMFLGPLISISKVVIKSIYSYEGRCL